MNRRNERKALDEVPIDDKITDRYYQKRLSELFAITSKEVTENFCWLWRQEQEKQERRQLNRCFVPWRICDKYIVFS